MILSCTDFTFPLLEHGAALDLVRLAGFNAVDLVFMDHSHLRPTELQDDPVSFTRALHQRLQDRELLVADILLIQTTSYGELAWNNPDAGRRAQARGTFDQVLQLGVAVGARGISLLPGIHWPQETFSASLRRSADELGRCVEAGDRAGIAVSVEPHLGSFAETPEVSLELIDASPGLTLTLDYGHFVYQGIAEERIEPLVRHSRHLHARGARRARLQTSVADNTIDFPRMVRAAREAGLDASFGLEYVYFHGTGPYAHCDESDTISETILLRDILRDEEERLS